MAEKEALREKEAEISEETRYDTALQERRKTNQLARLGKKLIRAKDIPFEINRQGIVRFYSEEGYRYKHLTNDNWSIFCHEIKQHSGKHVHQGGLVLFVLKGRGYTVVDEKRFDWSEGDLICLPIKKGGVVHQHFNLDGKPSRWVAFSNRRSTIGRFMEQKEAFSMWKENHKR